jgi:hypothetical protein
VVRACLLALLVLAQVPLQAADDESGWSPVQYGLQARLFIVPHTQTADWTYDVMVEFRNVLENSLGGRSEILLRFSKIQFTFFVTDSTGRSLPETLRESMGEWDEVDEMGGASGDLVLPVGARLSFPIGCGGGTPDKHSYPHGPGKLLSLDPMAEWIVPSAGGPYQLSATFTDPISLPHQFKAQGDFTLTLKMSPGVNDPIPYRGWRGTLTLPPVQLPQN